MKKLLSSVLAIAVIATFGVMALGSGSSDSSSSNSNSSSSSSTNATSKVESAQKSESSNQADSNKLSDYSVDIKSCRLAKDYEGKDVVIVKFGFTNNSDKATAFFTAIGTTLYQDGIGLNSAFMLADSAKYSSDNSTKSIKPGASLDVELAYELNDSKTDVEVEVKQNFSLDDKVIKKSFKIAE